MPVSAVTDQIGFGFHALGSVVKEQAHAVGIDVWDQLEGPNARCIASSLPKFWAGNMPKPWGRDAAAKLMAAYGLALAPVAVLAH